MNTDLPKSEEVEKQIELVREELKALRRLLRASQAYEDAVKAHAERNQTPLTEGS